MKNEKVLCFRKDSLPYLLGSKHFSIRRTKSEFCNDIGDAVTIWLDRHVAERSLEYKQIIPYILLENSLSGGFLVYSRKGSEKRLHGYLSAGVGGHINPEDESSTLYGTILNCAKREINEELGIEDIDNIRMLGVINEEYSSVGKVHFGIVCIVRIDNPLMIRADKEIAEYTFINNIAESIDDFELWTKLALELL